jgi:pyruvate formate lyase activating enzyme
LGIISRSAALIGAGAMLSSPAWLRAFISDAAAGKTNETLQALLETAPLARFWTSANDPDAKCATCHTPGEALLAKQHHHPDGVIKCGLCAQGCLIPEGERGGCRTRVNIDGELRTLVYGRPIAVHVDPIEKKPFYNYRPGSTAFSLATAGCPLHCQFCQNWELSQARPEDYPVAYTSPEVIVRSAHGRGAPIIAFTYNEPTVFTEYLTDIARQAEGSAIKCVLISCGFMTEAPLTEMCGVLDAIKIDLKGFSEEFYHKVSHAELKPVLRSIKQVARSGVHLELVNLVVPTLNDSDEMISGLVNWVASELGPDVPVHFTRFHPDYKLLNLPPTPVATLEKAYETARSAGLHYPYVGNVPGHPGNNTYCPKCGKTLIVRQGFFIVENHIIDGHCEYCNEAIAGVW